MMPFQHLQLGRVETLPAEAQPIHAVLAKHLTIFKIGGGGIDFDSPLLNRGKIESLAQADDQPLHLIQGQERRRSAPEENRARPASTYPQIRLAQDEIDE